MLTNLLDFLFKNSISRADSFILIIMAAYFSDRKYKKGIIAMFLGGFIVALLEALFNYN